MAFRGAALLLVLAVTACYMGPGTSDSELGACPRGMRKVASDGVLYESRLYGALPVFVEAGGAKGTGDRGQPGRLLDLTDAKPLRGSAAGFDPVATDGMTIERAEAAARKGMPLVVGGAVGPGGPYASVIVAIRDDGRVAFVGHCAYQNSERVREFLASRGRPADVLRRMVADPHGPDAAALRELVHPTPPNWDALPPSERRILAAPPAARRNLRSISLSFRLPDGWRGFGTSICQRLTTAVGECLRTPQGVPQAHLIGFLEPGKDLVVQAFRNEGGWDKFRPLVTIPYAVAAAADPEKGLGLQLTGDASISDVEVLLKRGREGPPPLTAAVVPL